MTANPLFRINVRIETFEDSGESRAEWNAHQHRSIEVMSALDRATKHQFAREDLLVSFRWCASVLARLALQLQNDILGMYRYRKPGTHDCATDREQDGSVRCGWIYEEGVATPKRAVDMDLCVPWVLLFVPTEDVEAWAKHFRRRVAEMLADDKTPLAPRADHQQIRLTEPIAEPRMERT